MARISLEFSKAFRWGGAGHLVTWDPSPQINLLNILLFLFVFVFMVFTVYMLAFLLRFDTSDVGTEPNI